MNKKDLDYLKNKIEWKKEGLKRYNEILKEIKEIIKNEDIKRYIEIINEIHLYNLSSVLELNKSFKLGFNKIFEDTMEQCQDRFFNEHNFYVYLGTFKHNKNKDIEVDYNTLNADYSKYINIEVAKPYEITIPIAKRDNFEKHNHILYRGIDEEAYTKSNMDYFHFVREIYYQDAMEKGEDIAVKRMFKRIRENNERREK